MLPPLKCWNIIPLLFRSLCNLILIYLFRSLITACITKLLQCEGNSYLYLFAWLSVRGYLLSIRFFHHCLGVFPHPFSLLQASLIRRVYNASVMHALYNYDYIHIYTCAYWKHKCSPLLCSLIDKLFKKLILLTKLYCLTK